MIQDYRLHGVLSDQIEYFATIAGHDISHRYFFEEEQDAEGNPRVRFFSLGNELILSSRGVTHKGNGGSFCEYMFGGDQPIEDLMRSEVLNRLVMYGGVASEDGSGIAFIPQTQGTDEYNSIFFDGHAVTNYFFFLYMEPGGEFTEQQGVILREIGKRLKRSPHVGRSNDLGLVHELLAELALPRCMLFLIRLVHKQHDAFYRLFREVYHRDRVVSDRDSERLQALATHYRINHFDQERMKIDVIYKHPDNKRIIDEYKDVLIEGERDQEISHTQRARLIRLRTLCVRNDIPIILPNILDELLLKNRPVAEVHEPTYIQECREIFEGIFLQEWKPDKLITQEDLAKLLWAKQQATERQDPTFDGILMDTVRICDELSEREGNDGPLENFGYIVTHFDRYDATYMIINHLAFNEDAELSGDKLRSLIGHKKVFDGIDPDLFYELFIVPVLRNKYLTHFGRNKIRALNRGLRAIERGDQSVADVLNTVSEIRRQEQLYLSIYDSVKSRIREVYTRIHSKEQRETMRKQLIDELSMNMEIDTPLLDRLLNQTILNINKEIYYTDRLLPQIVQDENANLRRDFFDNSGLDRFTLEELERQYYEQHQIDGKNLVALQAG